MFSTPPSFPLALFRYTLCACAILSSAVPEARASENGLGAPDGFDVSRFASDDLAHDIFAMTIDSRGRVVVSGPGYVRTLFDDDGDGQADRAVQFSDRPRSGAQGLLFLGDDLLYTGDGGLWLLRDEDGDGIADGEPQQWLELNIREHGAHAITLGPDGWVYVMCGNDTGMTAEQVTDPNSPITTPVAGCVVRVGSDGTQASIIADGFRNPYDLGFNAQGHLFTVDSDGERSHHLPWYTPTRLFDIARGQQHGWVLSGLQKSWSRPEAFFDNVPRVCELGRGSPSGLLVYRHHAFPQHYRDGVFTACWTLGRVYYVPLTPQGASYSGEPEIFLETNGDIGFAPVDLSVDPSGDLFVAVGGRGTQGGVFRVQYVGGDSLTTDDHARFPASSSEVLSADQPLSSWARASWLSSAHLMKSKEFVDAASGKSSQGEKLSTQQRIRAIEILVELRPKKIGSLISSIDPADKPRVAARLAWAIGCAWSELGDAELEVAQHKLAAFTQHEDEFPQRAAWEALCRMDEVPKSVLRECDWLAAFGSPSRYVRRAAIELTRQSRKATAIAKQQVGRVADHQDESRIHSSLLWARLTGDQPISPKRKDNGIRRCLSLLQNSDDPAVRLEMVRLIELLLGEIQAYDEKELLASGYALSESVAADSQIMRSLREVLASLLPSRDVELDREVARLLAMIGGDQPEVLEVLSEKWTPTSSPVDDVHYLTVLAKLDGARSSEVTARTAEALARLHEKLAAQSLYPSREWPVWIGAVFDELISRDAALPAAFVADSSFGHPEHAMFVLQLPEDLRPAAATRLLDQLEGDSYEELASVWTSTLVEALSALSDEILFPRLREVWDEGLLRDAIVEVLARSPSLEDRDRYFETLKSPQAPIVETAVQALLELPPTAEAEEIALAVSRLRQSCLAVGRVPPKSDKAARVKYRGLLTEEQPMREQLDCLLRHWSDNEIDVSENSSDSLLSQYQPWFVWFGLNFPGYSTREPGRVSAGAWALRLNSIDWSLGEAQRGEAIYRRTNCSQCHDGNARLGPELAPAVTRFSRKDFFAAVINPSDNISPQYQGVQVVTQDGRIYQGLPVYDSPEGLLLRTGATTTVRLTGDEIAVRLPSTRSFMPEGLLDNLSDEELADLDAYLHTLR